MKTFKQFINESEEFDLESFKKQCAPFLKASGGLPLYHGSQERIPGGDVIVRQWKERKGPSASSLELHDAANRQFSEMFGVNARNWLFTSGNLSVAKSFGSIDAGVFACFPIGDFQYLYSPDIDDLTGRWTVIDFDVEDEHPDLSEEDREKLSNKRTVEFIDNAQWFYNQKLKAGIKSGCEIMIKCDKFYLIRTNSSVYRTIIKPNLMAK